MTNNIREALQALVDWQSYCLNAYKPTDQKRTRSTPTDDDLCELFNRIDRARRVLAETPKASREITRRIYLTGTKGPTSYTVKTSGWDGNLDVDIQTARAGHSIVRALRGEAARRPDLFPPSKNPSGAKP